MAAKPDAGMQARLARGAEQLGLALNTTQLEALLAYQALLLKWNRVYNLTAIRSADEALTHHLLDSLSALPFLVEALGGVAGEVPSASGRVLDVGSGGGLPGIPLAICCPQVQVTLVDTVQKKTAFQTQVKAELRLDNVRPVAARVESLADEAPGYAVITSRAFAELADFVTLAGHLLAPDGVFMAMKGVLPQQEIERLPQGWEVAQIQALSVPGLDAERHLITIRRSVSG